VASGSATRSGDDALSLRLVEAFRVGAAAALHPIDAPEAEVTHLPRGTRSKRPRSV